ncbi:MAG: serine/threonine-protein kinase, partial [Planctomycetota bacterium]|nr:serine/threonine-protein kinase [Planctomycetota bacterium]
MGGGGVVYKAIQEPLDREVAVKILAPQQVKRGRDYVSRFLQEAKMAARLHHPNIVDVYGAGEEDGLYYIVMEYVKGNSLDRLLKGDRITDTGFWLDLMSQACEALVESHENGIIHRDIKPANMLLDTRNSVKLTDFGLAVWAEGGVSGSQDVAGTPYYIPPEVMNDMPLLARRNVLSLPDRAFSVPGRIAHDRNPEACQRSACIHQRMPAGTTRCDLQPHHEHAPERSRQPPAEHEDH